MEPETAPHDTSQDLAGDLLRGADEIAEFICGARWSCREVYYLAETSRLPVFRISATLCARRSKLMGWVVGQEDWVRSKMG